MRKWFSLILIGGGLFFLVYGGWQVFSGNIAQDEALGKARSVVSASENVQEKGVVPEDFNPATDEVIGILEVPRLDAELPIVEGTDEDDLEQGVGHYSGTAFPNQSDQIVLSGHRDTVFQNFGDLEIGDQLTVQMEYGTFTYDIQETEIVDADDRTVIQSTAPDEVLVLTTCYPFGYIGNAPDRYIIYATPTETD
ncbi:class D sortase [Alkalibacillus silvisoli]|uniref:Sortase SrtA n=1 Tax=Alkalibacillus silvisoli TaxID=392823 RepID=A0ABP3K3F6_9BACI